ncbi:hypothetical protein Klosneuvirus_6_24 [Klosneuvirus KNV1]|uniref:Uncharacterized protein n=1 Tax=Klosneuvirus KNV1 TaxID=1977640 RepID=A0A1V0SL66_9VIRU|nr:hypothetical protein Klosneuvirus_6_24 [Klosneuvirus KNV1]
MLSKQSKQNAIIKYLSKNDFDGDICVKELKEKDVNEIYDLYIHNDERVNTKTTNPGYYGVYYKINKQYDNMVLYYTKAISKNQKDDGALNELYDYWEQHSDVPSKITQVCDILEKENQTEFNRFNKLRILSLKNNPEPKIVIDPFNKINDSIETFIKNNELNKIYELYDKCDNDELKKKYLTKVILIPNFELSKIMIHDIMKMDFGDNVLTEINLIKCMYAGYRIDIQNIELEKFYDKYKRSNDDEIKKDCLIKLVSFSDFKPTKEMLNDIFRLEFDSKSPPEIHMIKSIFAGIK